jgi:hypothetical protein
MHGICHGSVDVVATARQIIADLQWGGFVANLNLCNRNISSNFHGVVYK